MSNISLLWVKPTAIEMHLFPQTKAVNSQVSVTLLVSYSNYIEIYFYSHSHLLLTLVENQSSSRNTTPGLEDIINDPMQALTKGWSLLSTGMEELGKVAAEGVKVAAQSAGQLSRYTNDNYIKPAQSQWNDPNFRNNVTGYVQTFGEKTRNLVNDSFNQSNRNNSSSSLRSSYSSSSHTNNDNNDDFFNSTISSLQQQTPTSRSASPSSQQAPSRTRTPLRESSTIKKTSSAAKKDSDDEWEGW